MSIKNLSAYALPSADNEYKLVDNVQGGSYSLMTAACKYDESGFIPQEVGVMVQGLFDDDYVIGIHRVKENQVVDTFENGIINNADSKYSSSEASIEKNVDFYRNHIYLLGELKNSSYFNGDGAIVVKIPRYYMKNYTAHEIQKPIFYKDENENIRLLPEYVYGFVKVDHSSNIVGFIKNPKYTDNHTYSNEGLIFDNMPKIGRHI